VEEGNCNITVMHGAFSKTISVSITDPIVVPNKAAHWTFEDADLRKATIGQDLVYGKRIDSQPRTSEIPTADLAGFTAINGPKSDNKGVRVAQWYFFQATHGIAPNGGGTTGVNDYTIMYDFRIPLTGWHCFLQTDPNDDGDGDLFTNGSGRIGVGTTGYSTTAVPQGEWHRLVATVKSGEFVNYYLDGSSILAFTNVAEIPVDGHRLVLQSKAVLLGDEDGEDNDIEVSEIAMWSQALDADQVKKLERIESKLR
jgi:hypothetical protein